jgi:hypothetical protein
MNVVSALIAALSLAASGALHAWLFWPMPECLVPLVPVRLDEEPARARADEAPAVSIVDRVPAARPSAAPGPADQGSASQDSADQGTLAAGGELREALILDYRVEDELAVLDYAASRELVLVLLDPKSGRSWPLSIDRDGRVGIPSGHPAKAERYLLLPARSAARSLRYGAWCERGRALHRIPGELRLELALAIPDTRLDDEARAAVGRACAERGLQPEHIARAVLKPRALDGVVGLELVELVLDSTSASAVK